MVNLVATICLLLAAPVGAPTAGWVKCQLHPGIRLRSPGRDGAMPANLAIHFIAKVVHGRLELLEFTDRTQLDRKGTIQNYFRNAIAPGMVLKQFPDRVGWFKFQFDSREGDFSLYYRAQTSPKPWPKAQPLQLAGRR